MLASLIARTMRQYAFGGVIVHDAVAPDRALPVHFRFMPSGTWAFCFRFLIANFEMRGETMHKISDLKIRYRYVNANYKHFRSKEHHDPAHHTSNWFRFPTQLPSSDTK